MLRNDINFFSYPESANMLGSQRGSRGCLVGHSLYFAVVLLLALSAVTTLLGNTWFILNIATSEVTFLKGWSFRRAGIGDISPVDSADILETGGTAFAIAAATAQHPLETSSSASPASDTTLSKLKTTAPTEIYRSLPSLLKVRCSFSLKLQQKISPRSPG